MHGDHYESRNAAITDASIWERLRSVVRTIGDVATNNFLAIKDHIDETRAFFKLSTGLDATSPFSPGETVHLPNPSTLSTVEATPSEDLK